MLQKKEDIEGPIQTALNALSNKHRLKIMMWLTEPEKYFPPQKDCDLVEDGVCVGLITKKVGLSQPTVTNHMKSLANAKLVSSKKIKNWVYYRSNSEMVDEFIRNLNTVISKK